MNKNKKEQKLGQSYNRIMKAVEGLTNGEAIVQLECAKLDLILNTGMIVIDGETGLIEEEEKSDKSTEQAEE